jgi:hypothetical protein
MDLAELVLAVRLLSSPDPASVKSWDDSGLATVYHTPTDLGKWRGSVLACLWNKAVKDFADDQLFCAHRSYRCGTVLHVYMPKTRKSSYCVVADRGPYGAKVDGKFVVKIRKGDPGVWRGILDMSPGVLKNLGGTGYDHVRIKKVRLRTQEPAL